MHDTGSGVSLEARSLSLAYPGRQIIRDLDLQVPAGRFTALLGPNGSGKSTLLRALAGLMPASGGSVLLDGAEVTGMPRHRIARRLSLLPQSPRAPEDITVRDLVTQGRYPHRRLFDRWSAADEATCVEALALTDMTPLRDRALSELSGGQRQRAWIAMTLAQAADILLLDEPTTYLDLSHQLDVLALMRRLVHERGKTVVSVLHDLNHAARFADVMVLLDKGRIAAAGSPAQVMEPAMIAQVFDVEALIIPDPVDATPVCIPRR
ncbi:ABC transporter ATP-binding protein [Xanthobacteraceae bacterium A53D]